MTAWLYTIDEDLSPMVVGETFDIWTFPRTDGATGEILFKSDGSPHMPTWTGGDDLIVYHPSSRRCVLFLTASGAPWWDPNDERIHLDTVVRAHSPNGFTLTDIGVSKASQGGRQRLTPEQHDAAARAFGLS